MATEKQWVDSLKARLKTALRDCKSREWTVGVCSGWRLTYAHEILQYDENSDPEKEHSAGYQTDILIYDEKTGGSWVPRVVVECKIGGVTTHDALTYGAKATTHKHVHPYLRYGILIGNFDDALPGRLIRHGAYFDFMMVSPAEKHSKKEFAELVDLLQHEVESSRTLQTLLTENRVRSRKRFRLLHRRLAVQ